MYGHERPYQALRMRFTAELNAATPRPCRGLSKFDDPLHEQAVTVTHCGRVCVDRRRINLSTVFASQNAGVEQVDWEGGGQGRN